MAPVTDDSFDLEPVTNSYSDLGLDSKRLQWLSSKEYKTNSPLDGELPPPIVSLSYYNTLNRFLTPIISTLRYIHVHTYS